MQQDVERKKQRTLGGLRGKSLWVRLSLLIALVVLAAGVLWYKQARTLAVEQDRNNEQVLQAYFDDMTALMQRQNLRGATKESEVRASANTKTLETLKILDSERKGRLVQFLYEEKLVKGKDAIISLEGADLSGVNLSDAYLNGADLSGADLNGANLSHANLVVADLRYTNMSSADLSEADLKGTNLSKANLSHATLAATDLRLVDLSESDLSYTNLNMANLGYTNLSTANLSFADLNRVNLRGAVIDESTLLDDKWQFVWEIVNQGVAGADLSGRDLSYTNLSNADLSGVNLNDANLFRANLIAANLRYAFLSSADLSGANLSDAYMFHAYLRGADLSRATISYEQLALAYSLEGATMPDGETFDPAVHVLPTVVVTQTPPPTPAP
ncbi:MAG: pentapeptide repeat-containing protein [Chloroflexota bacterium]